MVHPVHTGARRCYRGDTMAKRVIVIILVALVVVGLTSYAYTRYRDRRIEAGEVVDESGNAVGSGAGGQTKVANSTNDGSDDESARVVGRRPAFATVSPAAVTPVQTPSSAAPATDTIAANPPNGRVFAGTGQFQVYRQGDLTWRVNTADGSTCILFATEEQWRKPIVYRNGCVRG